MVAGLGAILGGVGSIAGAFSSARQQEETNKTNQMINMINFMMRQQEREDMLRQAQKQETMAMEGTRDAQGNVVRYVPGKGWVTILSNESQEMQDMQQAEQAQVLGQDLPMRRRQLKENAGRQVKEGEIANQLREELTRVRVDPERLKAEMLAGASRGTNDIFDKLVSSAARNAVRTGSSNFGSVLAATGKERAKALSDQMASIPGQARQQAAQLEQGEKANLTNLYNAFANRAGAMPGVSYAPQNITGTADQFLGQGAARGASAGGAMLSALSRSGPSFDYQQPDDGFGAALGVTGQAIGNVADTMSGQKEKDRIYNAFMQRFKSGGGWV